MHAGTHAPQLEHLLAEYYLPQAEQEAGVVDVVRGQPAGSLEHEAVVLHLLHRYVAAR